MVKYVRWAGYLAASMAFSMAWFGSCGEEPLAEDAVDSAFDRLDERAEERAEEREASIRDLHTRVDEHIREVEARMAETAREREVEAERASIPTISVASMSLGRARTLVPHTPVQLAPGMFPASLPFDRLLTEREILTGYNSLYELCVLVFSRITVHEGGWMHRPCAGGGGCDRTDHNHAELDGPALFQVFRYTRRDHETFMGVMRRHVNYATEEREPRRNRSRWIVELDLEGTRPEHFPPDLNWERDYLPRWREVIAQSRDLFEGRRRGVCARAPIITWGGRCEDAHGACDDDFGRRRGLVPFECGDSSNRFWCRPGEGGCPTTASSPPPAPVASETTDAPEATGEASEALPVEAPIVLPSEPVLPETEPLALAP